MVSSCTSVSGTECHGTNTNTGSISIWNEDFMPPLLPVLGSWQFCVNSTPLPPPVYVVLCLFLTFVVYRYFHCDFGLRGFGYGSWLLRCGAVSWGKALHLYVHSIDPGVIGYLAGQWLLVCLHSFQCCDGSRAVCSPGSWPGTTRMDRSHDLGNIDVKHIELLDDVALYKHTHQ